MVDHNTKTGQKSPGLDPEGLFTGGGALEAAGLKQAAQAVSGGEVASLSSEKQQSPC